MIGELHRVFLTRPSGKFTKNLSQDYIKLNTILVNKFNNFNNICNILHISVKKNATRSVGSCLKAIILIIILHLIKFDIRRFIPNLSATMWYIDQVASMPIEAFF